MNPDEHATLRPFFLLWSGQALSLVGSQAVQFALIWWLTATTGSAAVLAGASFLGLLPQIALGPFIGALVDRWNRKKVMLVADSAVAAAAVLVALLFLFDAVRTEYVFALLLVRSLGGAFHGPAMLASTSLMVPEKHLTRIQGLNQSLHGGRLIISAPLGALLYGLLPMAGVMAVDVITALFAIAPLFVVHVPRPESGASNSGSVNARTVWRDVVAGFAYLRERHGHLAILGMAAAINMCMVPAFSLLPLLVSGWGGGVTEMGWISSTLGVGTVAGGIVLGIWGGFRPRILTTFAALVAIGVATVLLGWSTSLVEALGAVLAVGLFVPLCNGPIQAVLQATVAPDFQGRVFTLYGSLAGLTAPLGLIVAAPIAEIVGVSAWYTLGGLACMTMGALGFFVPSIARIEHAATGPPAPSAAAR